MPRALRIVPLSTACLGPVLGFLLMLGGCGETAPDAGVSEQNKQNMADELKASEENQKRRGAGP